MAWNGRDTKGPPTGGWFVIRDRQKLPDPAPWNGFCFFCCLSQDSELVASFFFVGGEGGEGIFFSQGSELVASFFFFCWGGEGGEGKPCVGLLLYWGVKLITSFCFGGGRKGNCTRTPQTHTFGHQELS